MRIDPARIARAVSGVIRVEWCKLGSCGVDVPGIGTLSSGLARWQEQPSCIAFLPERARRKGLDGDVGMKRMLMLQVSRTECSSLLVGLGALLFCLVATVPVCAQGVDAGPRELTQLEQRIEELRQLRTAADGAYEADRDGYFFRFDQLMLEALAAAESAFSAVSQAAANATDLEARLIESTDWLLRTATTRIEEIYSRTSQARREFDEFDRGLQASVSRAFVQDMQVLSFQYTERLGRLLRVREQLGLSVADERNSLVDFSTRQADRLHGQIRLDAQTLAELRRALRSDPANTGAESALRAVGEKQSRNLSNLSAWLDILQDQGVDVSSHRALLIQQQGRLGTEILQRDVFASIWREQTDRLWRNLVRNGPSLLIRVLTFVAVLTLAWIVARLVRGLLEMMLSSSLLRVSQLMKEQLLSLAFGLVFLAGAVVALATLGWSVMPMLAGLGVVGLVVAFALQDSLKNFVAGWMILIYRAYDVGDYVRVSGGEGRVRQMTLTSTRITTRDNTSKLVPNRKIWDDTIVNLTASRARRLELEIPCRADNDMDQVEECIRELLAEHLLILNKPKPEVFLLRSGASEMVFAVQPWVKSEDYWALQKTLLKKIRQRLQREGIA